MCVHFLKLPFLKRYEDCVESVQIQSYFWSVFSCILTEYRKIRSRNNSVFGYFSRNDAVFLFKNTGDKEKGFFLLESDIFRYVWWLP